MRRAMSRVRFVACLGVAAGAMACGRARSADTPPARVSAAVPVAAPRVPARDTAPRWMEPRQPGDQCRRANGEDDRPPAPNPPDGVGHEDLSHGLEFLCTLRERHPARLVLQADADGNPAAVLVYDSSGATVAADTLRIEDSEPPYAGGTIVEGEDLNGDGWTDVRVMTYFGSGGRMFDVFRYHPARHRFEKDSVISGGNISRAAGTPCAHTSWKTGAGDWSWTELCWRNGRWVETRAERQARSVELSTRDVWVYIREKRERRGGRLRVVSADTLRDRIRP